MNVRVRGGGHDYGRGPHGSHGPHGPHVCNFLYLNLNFHGDDLCVLDAIRRMFFHIPPLSRNYLHSCYIHHNLSVHIFRIYGCDTNVEFEQNSLFYQLTIHIWVEHMDECHLFRKIKIIKIYSFLKKFLL